MNKIALASLLLGALWLAGCDGSPSEQASSPPPPVYSVSMYDGANVVRSWRSTRVTFSSTGVYIDTAAKPDVADYDVVLAGGTIVGEVVETPPPAYPNETAVYHAFLYNGGKVVRDWAIASYAMGDGGVFYGRSAGQAYTNIFVYGSVVVEKVASPSTKVEQH